MSAQRFQAPTTIEALRRIKAELGPDAVVLSSNDVPSGVEIVAIAAADLVTLKKPPAAAPHPLAQDLPPDSGISQRWANRLAQDDASPDLPFERIPVSQTAVRRAMRDLPPRDEAELTALYEQRLPRPASPDTVAAPWRGGLAVPVAPSPLPVRAPFPTTVPAPAPVQVRTPDLPRMPAPLTRRPAAPAPPTRTASPAGRVAAPPLQPQPPLPPPAPAAPDPAVTGLTAQMSEMKAMLSGHLAANMWSSLQQEAPARALLTRRLLNAGLSSQVIAQMLAELPAEETLDALLVHAHHWVQARLETRDAFALFDQGGVYAFLGPTGVGKTTTVAKIAARCVLRYGRQQVALLTTDTYRIGAQEQLKVFARILGLPVVSLRDSEDLQTKLADLSKRKVVLLDTAGVGQRDSMMLEQLEMIREGCADVHRVLVMSATTSTRTLDDVVEAHQNALGVHNIDAAIVTKMDEGMSLAPAMDCVMRHRLPLLFLANGQRVPEDLFTADAAYLAHRTLSPRGRDTSDTDVSHIPALMADEMSTWTEHLKKP